MDYKAYYKALKDGSLPNCMLFYGDEDYVMGQALAALRKAMLPEGLEALNETVFEGAVSADALREALDTLPLMADMRLVIVRESPLTLAGGREGDDRRVADLLGDVPPTVRLVFYTTGAADMRKKVPQRLKGERTVRFDHLNERERQAWLAREAARLGVRAGSGVLEALTVMCEPSLWVLSGELSKLAAYAGEGGEIALADAEALVTATAEWRVYQLADALLEGRHADALEMSKTLVRGGESRVGMLAALTNGMRQAWQARLMLDAGREREVADALAIAPFIAKRVTQSARRHNAAALGAAVSMLVDTDYAIKSGGMTDAGGWELALQRVMRGLAVTVV